LCASLFGNSSKYLHTYIGKNKIPETFRTIILKITTEKVLLAIFYILFALLCVYVFSDIGPTLITDVAKLLNDFSQRFGIDIGSSGLQTTL
jgi:TRAP-type C4-dicarboxylate transport system permease large subunit